MGRIDFDRKSKVKRFFSGKGFYVALAVCLVAVCGVAVVTFVNAVPGLSKKEATGTTAPTVTRTTSLQQVGKPVTNVPDDRTVAKTTVHTTTASTSATTEAPAELFVLPLTNEVTQGFSDGKQVYSQTMNDWRTHDGVDFKGEKGQAVKAIADGTVSGIVSDPLWGSMVTIDHGYGVTARYCGVTVTNLKEGQAVKAGAVIGTLSEIPCEIVEGLHLHLEVLVNDEYTDPVEAIGRDVKTVPTTTGTSAK